MKVRPVLPVNASLGDLGLFFVRVGDGGQSIILVSYLDGDLTPVSRVMLIVERPRLILDHFLLEAFSSPKQACDTLRYFWRHLGVKLLAQAKKLY